MARYHNSIKIKAPLKEVYQYVHDPLNIPEYMVGMVETHNITSSGVGQHFDWTYKMAGIPLKGETTVTEDVPDDHYVTKNKGEGGLESTWIYSFKPEKEYTVLDIYIDYKVPVPVLGKLAEKLIVKMNQREGDINLQNIKDKLENR